MTACPFTPKTLAERWECSPNHVLKLAREGKLSFFRIGKMYRFPVDAVEAYERGNTVTSCDRDDDRSEPVILDFPNTLRDVLRATREA
jgi:excisionase family DNA binding protein